MSARAAPVALPVALGVTLGACSERGRPAVNQDFHGACVPRQPQRHTKGVVLAVADGIGSSAVSQDASQTAVRAALEDYYATSEAWSVRRSMQRVLAATNSWLHAQTRRGAHPHDPDRGYVCTLSVLVLKGRTAHVFHVGDTRVGLVQGRHLEPLTEDHRVWLGGGQSHLARAIGFRERLELDHVAVPLEAGQVFVLTSDGVHDHVHGAVIAATIARHGDDLDAAARDIVEQALAAGSDDNATVQIVRVDTVPEAELAEAQRLRDGLRPPPLLKARDEIDGYRIERELHASSRSHVYLATDRDSGTPVVLKTPSIDLGHDEAYLDRFVLEEWIARRIDSPHVMKAHVSARPRTQLYVAFEQVAGQTLAQWMRDHPAPDLETVRAIVEQVARGLQAFHRLEMLHQDLRPENLMIDAGGTVKIIDLGSTHVAGLADDAVAAPRAMLGTISTAAPELFLGEPATERSDQFSLGVVAYQLLTGQLPYGTQVPRVRTRDDVRRLSYVSARQHVPTLPAWVDAALARAVHPLPHKRYEALSEFTHDLRQPSADHQASRRLPLAERHPLRFWQGLSLALALLVLLLAARLHQATRTAEVAPVSTAIPMNERSPS